MNRSLILPVQKRPTKRWLRLGCGYRVRAVRIKFPVAAVHPGTAELSCVSGRFGSDATCLDHAACDAHSRAALQSGEPSHDDRRGGGIAGICLLEAWAFHAVRRVLAFSAHPGHEWDRHGSVDGDAFDRFAQYDPAPRDDGG